MGSTRYMGALRALGVLACAAALGACAARGHDGTALPATKGGSSRSSGAQPAVSGYQGPPVATGEAAVSRQLVAGAPIYVGSGPSPARCTAGFSLVGTGGVRYWLTAGHCARGEKNAPVFVNIGTPGPPGGSRRVQVGTITQNQYQPDYKYEPDNPAPFPDLAVFSPNAKTWPAPASSNVASAVMTSRVLPADMVMKNKEAGGSLCWPVAGGESECGTAEWVRGNFVGIRPKNPDWTGADRLASSPVGDAFPGTPIWASDSKSHRDGIVGIVSFKLPNGVYVANAIEDFTSGQYEVTDAIDIDMPDGYVPDPYDFTFPK